MSEYADRARDRCARRVIRALRGIKDTLSGDDSPLSNAWEEFCVQVQLEHSAYWTMYERTVHDLAKLEAQRLSPLDCQAIWLQTQRGEDWLCSDEGETDLSPPWMLDDVVESVRMQVEGLASDWSNPAIRRYLEDSSPEHD